MAYLSSVIEVRLACHWRAGGVSPPVVSEVPPPRHAACRGLKSCPTGTLTCAARHGQRDDQF
jgi:hypothetical protein